MFQLNHLSLTQFRNYARRDFVFTERIVGICGKNGTGKTNLLDSIYYLSLTKSYFSRPDAQNVLRGTEGLRVEGNYAIAGKTHKVVFIVRENGFEFLTHGLNSLIFFAKLLSGSEIFILYPFFFNSFATWKPVSRLINLSIEIPPESISIFFFNLF